MRRPVLFPLVALASSFALLMMIAVGTVAAAPVATLVSIAVIPSNPSVPAGLQQQFTALGTFSDGSTQDLTTGVTWSSSFHPVATISNDAGSAGLAATLTSGTSTIAATDGTVTGSTVLTVTSPVLVAITVTPSNPTVSAGTTQQFTATGSYSNGATQDLTTTVSWSSSVSSVATISNAAGAQGLATGLAAGTTTITATSGGVTNQTSLSVTQATLQSIAVTPANPSVPAGLQQQFTASGTFSDGSTEDVTATVTWSSSVPAVATISNDAGSTGLAAALTSGTSTIAATDGTVTGSTVLTVTSATLLAIEVTPASPSISAGHTLQFAATGIYSDGSRQDLTAAVTWSSSLPSTATISNAAGSQGLATGVATGTTEITATAGAVSDTVTLTVPSTTCAGGPFTSCKVPGVTTFTLRNEADPRRNEMSFSWKRGDATAASELGDPTVDTQYSVCVWDRVAGIPTLVMEMVAPADGDCGGRPCWRPIARGGFRYNDPGLDPNGLRRLTLQPGAAGRSRVIVNGHGRLLPNPPMPFKQIPAITVQVVNSLGTCWAADYVSSLQRNTAQTLRAREMP